MEQIKEAVYLINDERYLHLRENGAGVGFATYNKVTGEPLESGQISEKNLPPDGRNAIPAARNWYLFELSDDDRKAIQQESVKILENIPQAGIGRRRIWEPETLPKDIRLINSHYDDLYRIPDGGVVQVDYPDGRSFTARVEHLDDYHFDMGGLGNVFHICQFAEVMERNHADFYPEIQTQDEQAAWELGGKGYLAIQSCEDGWDYTIYHSDYSVMDGGQLDAPELTIQEAREQILEAHHMEKGRRLLQDYDAVMDKVAEAEELSADHRSSTLEKLAELASDTSAPKILCTFCAGTVRWTMQQKWNQNFDGEPMTDIPQKFLNAGCDVYMVMQLRHDEKILDERFASMRELHRRGKTPDPEHYEVTYYADLPAMWQDVPSNEVLEELFQMFNISRPQDFEGHSLSVSDVIALKRNGEVSVHYVDSIGFKDLQGFLDKQPERPSVLMNLKEKCDAPECNPTGCRKAKAEHEL